MVGRWSRGKEKERRRENVQIRANDGEFVLLIDFQTLRQKCTARATGSERQEHFRS